MVNGLYCFTSQLDAETRIIEVYDAFLSIALFTQL